VKNPIRVCLFAISLIIGITTSAHAADCKERVEKVRNEIERDKEKYTRESRTEANKHLMQANMPSVNPMQCTEHITKAKKALRQGKQ
jgi:20S proteasome alpha/beta subunit